MRFGDAFGGLIPGARGEVLAVLLRTGVPLTGRQVHALLSDQFSLWSVQQALAALVGLGVVESQTVGRAMIHSINEDHYAIGPLRVLLDPYAALRDTVRDAVGSSASAVVLFGSVARGEAIADSDIDLVVLAPPDWDGRSELQEAVRTRIGNHCDILVFTPAEFARLAASGDEPVVSDILADGVALLGSLPQTTAGVA
jgi:predicted nucleotidyltransferase